ncbi:hypothetical protein GSI_08783 [Ganoderma sinense ZZ0214-1]|uniref:Uncharacterized protein n=1 Tax=Ganoderma sinense ZZ0214-1 TaxID=1077348 RepID=A0A2G8S4M8_9APHY|nr:hypothetical protein GSI_08783 [Ganoderma sinense ZZ0214-1]
MHPLRSFGTEWEKKMKRENKHKHKKRLLVDADVELHNNTKAVDEGINQKSAEGTADSMKGRSVPLNHATGSDASYPMPEIGPKTEVAEVKPSRP